MSVMKDNLCPDDLTQQVDAAFEEARIDLSTLWAGLETPQDTVAPPPPPPAPPAPPTPKPLAPKAPSKFVPPPPPPAVPQEDNPAERPVGSPNSLWDNFSDQLEEGSDTISSSDPIAAFSPAPRMDWGPTKNVAGRLPFRKRGEMPGDPSAQPA